MANVIYNGNFIVCLEMKFEDCEILVDVLRPELAHLQRKNGLNRALLYEGELTEAKRKKLEKSGQMVRKLLRDYQQKDYLNIRVL